MRASSTITLATPLLMAGLAYHQALATTAVVGTAAITFIAIHALKKIEESICRQFHAHYETLQEKYQLSVIAIAYALSPFATIGTLQILKLPVTMPIGVPLLGVLGLVAFAIMLNTLRKEKFGPIEEFKLALKSLYSNPPLSPDAQPALATNKNGLAFTQATQIDGDIVYLTNDNLIRRRDLVLFSHILLHDVPGLIRIKMTQEAREHLNLLATNGKIIIQDPQSQERKPLTSTPTGIESFYKAVKELCPATLQDSDKHTIGSAVLQSVVGLNVAPPNMLKYKGTEPVVTLTDIILSSDETKIIIKGSYDLTIKDESASDPVKVMQFWITHHLTIKQKNDFTARELKIYYRFDFS
jgi:hypothetical protein